MSSSISNSKSSGIALNASVTPLIISTGTIVARHTPLSFNAKT
jgi:hypothetical protein